MSISDVAQRQHDALFADQPTALENTDPELVALFDPWAFDEVVDAAPLDTPLRLQVQLAALIACGAVSEYRVMLGAALQAGVSPVEVKEIVYQSVPYVGMGRVFDFIHATNDVLQNRGVSLPLPPQSTTTAQTRQQKGLAIQKQMFGEERMDAMIARAPTDQRHIQRFLSANCFGDYYTRDGLDLRTRELLTFVLLAALGGCEPQMAAHVVGNLAVGNDRGVLIATVTQLLPYIGYPRALNALRVINEGTSS